MGTVHAAHVAGVGQVPVNAAERTRYIFAPDDQSQATCAASCAHSWPPLQLRHGKPISGRGISAKLLRTIKGAGDVTYDNWPLHDLVGDSGPGSADKVVYTNVSTGAAPRPVPASRRSAGL
jgi:predicted lipoprotein with Yx(FWY)xxD motif